MRIFFTFFFTLIILHSYGQDGWQVLDIPSGKRYDDIYFLNAKTGWAAGGPSRKIYKTIDGGQHWVKMDSLPKYLRAIEFLDENVGFVGSLGGSFYKSMDGGKTWVDIAPSITPAIAGICGLAKADANTIYGMGIWHEPAFIVKSIDRGEHWSYIDMSAYATSLIDAHFFNANEGFVVGAKSSLGAVILYTNDGGVTWTEKFHTEGLSDRIWKIQSPDNIHFYGSIESLDPAPTRIVRSNDRGQTWEVILVDSDWYNLQAVGFLDTQLGWTGGKDVLFETRDGGVTWSKVQVGVAYNRFQKINDDIAYLSGDKIYKFMRNITGTIDDVIYDPIHTVSVTPNPTTGKSTLVVNFGTETLVKIYLYTTSGKQIKTLFSGRSGPGELKLDMDLSGTPSKEVIVLLKTNEGLITHKVIKQ